ncbi:MAG: HK97 family phage prohead protease, partial [Pararhodobacter sp.]
MVEGIAWPFGSPDRVGDLIEKGAFAKALPPIPMLAFHEQRETVGVWDEITETPEGLRVKGRLLIEDLPRAREVRAMIRERALSGLSIGFATTKSAPRRGTRGRTIAALDLLEISVVAVPSHPGARITSAKEHDMSEESQTPDIAALEAKVTEIEQKADTSALVARLDKLEAKANRPGATTGQKDEPTAERKAFAA